MNILVCEDDAVFSGTLVRLLDRNGHVAEAVGSGEEALVRLDNENQYDCVLTDLVMPGMDGLQLLEKIKTQYSGLDVVVMTGYGTVQTAVQAMKNGAFDFLTKPFEKDELLLLLDRLQEVRSLQEKVRRLEGELGEIKRISSPIIGSTRNFVQVQRTLQAAAKTDEMIWLTGPIGSGRSTLAAWVHHLSRSDRPYLEVDCEVIPRQVVEDTFFGNAQQGVKGYIRQCAGGNLYLGTPEILGPQLLDKLVREAGDANIRLIFGSEETLDKLLKAGDISEGFDLNFVFRCELPPLRERKGDLAMLVSHFLKEIGKRYDIPEPPVTDLALRTLNEYEWPGNLRELEAVLTEAMLTHRPVKLDYHHLPERLREKPIAMSSPAEVNIENLERDAILRALDYATGNKSMAAKMLGMSRASLYRKMKTYGLKDDR